MPNGLSRLAEQFIRRKQGGRIESLLHGLPELQCRVLELRLSGHSVAEIAAQLHVARHTVYQAMNVLQDRLKQSL